MPVRSILVFLGALFCAQALAAEAAAPVERPARIRLFGQNGVALTMYTNARCEREYDEEIDASGSLSHGFRTLLGKKRRNVTIGIPETDNTRNLAARDRLMANPYYLEYPLVPGQPVMLEAQVSNNPQGWGCARRVQVAFVPEPGEDYEGDMIRDFENGVCLMAIRRVAVDGQLSPVRALPVRRACEAEPTEAVPLMVMLFEPDRLQYRSAEAGAGVEELDDDEDDIEDFEAAIAEAPILPGMTLCIVAAGDAEASPLGSRLPALLEARGTQVRVVRGDANALQAEWRLTEERPLTFPLAEYYCRSIAGY